MIRWNSHAYAGNPVFAEDANRRTIMNQSDSDKGSWIGWWQGDFQSGDEFVVKGEWSGGTAHVVWQFEAGNYGGKAISAPGEVVTIPASVRRFRLDGRKWNESGMAVFTDFEIAPHDALEILDPDAPSFVDFPPQAEAGAFTLFWTPIEGVENYSVIHRFDSEPWEPLGDTPHPYWDDELLLEDIGRTKSYRISYALDDGGLVFSDEASVEIIAKQYPIPPVPDRMGSKVSGWLFGTNLALQLEPDSPILSIFNGAEFGQSSGAPVTGHIYGRSVELWVGSPEYLIGEAVDEEIEVENGDSN